MCGIKISIFLYVQHLWLFKACSVWIFFFTFLTLHFATFSVIVSLLMNELTLLKLLYKKKTFQRKTIFKSKSVFVSRIKSKLGFVSRYLNMFTKASCLSGQVSLSMSPEVVDEDFFRREATSLDHLNRPFVEWTLDLGILFLILQPRQISLSSLFFLSLFSLSLSL